MRGTCLCTKWKVALHIICCLTFSKLSLFRNAPLQCKIHILAKFNNLQQGRFCYYCLIKVYFVSDKFSVSGFFLFWFVCFFFNPLPICSQGEGNLISRLSSGAGGFNMIWSGPLSNPPICPGSGGGGFNWLVHYFVFTLPNEIENNLIYLLHKFLIAAYHTCPVQENRNYECLDNLNSAKYRKITPPPDM